MIPCEKFKKITILFLLFFSIIFIILPIQRKELIFYAQNFFFKLPYKGSRLAMYLVLPNDNKNIGDTLQAMENVKDLDQDLSEANITISLPKFKIESSYKLKKSLNKLGLETLFDSSQADLTGLNENPKDKSLFVDEVVQKAFIEGY